MFISNRFLRKKPEDNSPTDIKLFLWLIIIILSVFLFINFFTWLNPPQRSLLPQADGLTILEQTDDVAKLVSLPTQTLDSTLYAAGLYTREISEFPKGTVSVVYVKNDWRFVEIDFLPNRTSQEYLATHIYPTQEIVLDNKNSLWILTIDSQPRCIDYEDDVPNRCEISRHLITDLEDRLLLIAADGEQATNGELIEMAKSIIEETKKR